MILTLTITYDDQTGNVNVNGPVENKGMCYLMLECARDAVKDHGDAIQRAAVAARAAIPPTPTVVPNDGLGTFVRRLKKGKR